MKKNKIKYVPHLLFVFMVVIASLSSCKKTDATTPAPTGMGHLYFHLHTDIQSTEVDSGFAGPDINGRYFQLTYAQFFISNITIYQWNGTGNIGTPCNLPVTAGMLKYIDNEYYYIVDVPAGNYGSVSYDIGITPQENALAPNVLYSQFNQSVNGLPPTMPNYAAKTPMWDAVHGYTVLYVQGLADTNKIVNGMQDTTNIATKVNVPFTYAIYAGANPSIKGPTQSYHVQLPIQQFTILPGQITYVHQICDYGNLFLNNRFVNCGNLANPNVTSNWSKDSASVRSINQLLSRLGNNFTRYEMATINP